MSAAIPSLPVNNDLVLEAAHDNKQAAGTLVLDAKEQSMIGAIKSSPDATPLALNTIKSRMENIVYHLSLSKILVDERVH